MATIKDDTLASTHVTAVTPSCPDKYVINSTKNNTYTSTMHNSINSSLERFIKAPIRSQVTSIDKIKFKFVPINTTEVHPHRFGLFFGTVVTTDANTLCKKSSDNMGADEAGGAGDEDVAT